MNKAFDAYHEWLAIPKEFRPPTYYQLLGISASETNPKVIEIACLRQSTFVRSFQKGSYAEDANRILSELSEARAVLSDPVRKRAYDATLPSAKLIMDPKSNSTKLPFVDLEEPVIKIDPSRSSVRNEVPSSSSSSYRARARRNDDVELEVNEEVVEVLRPRPSKAKRKQQQADTQFIRLLVILGCIAVVMVAGVLVIRSVTKPSQLAVKPGAAESGRESPKEVPPAPVKKEETKPEPKKESPPPAKEPEKEKDLKKEPPQEKTDPPPRTEQEDLKKKTEEENEDLDPAFRPEMQPENSVVALKELSVIGEKNSPFAYEGRLPRARRRTGFVIGTEGYFLTSGPFVDEDANGMYVTVNGEQFRAKVTAASEKVDLVLLKIEGAPTLASLPVEFDYSVQGSEVVNVYGFEHFGANCCVKKLNTGRLHEDKHFTFDAPFTASSDGGVVVNRDGQVIAVVCAQKQKNGDQAKPCCVVYTAREFRELLVKRGLARNKGTGGNGSLDQWMRKAVGIAQIRANPRSPTVGERNSLFPSRNSSFTSSEVNQDLIDGALSLPKTKTREKKGISNNREDEEALRVLQNCYPVYRRREAAAMGKRNLDKSMIEIAALQVYAAYSDENVLDRYQRYLGDSHELRRGLAIEGLGRTRDPKVVPTLIGLINDGKSGTQWAQRGLRHCGKVAEPALIRKLESANDTEQNQILQLLTEFGTERSLQALKKISQQKPTSQNFHTTTLAIARRLKADRKVDFRIDFTPIQSTGE